MWAARQSPSQVATGLVSIFNNEASGPATDVYGFLQNLSPLSLTQKRSKKEQYCAEFGDGVEGSETFVAHARAWQLWKERPEERRA